MRKVGRGEDDQSLSDDRYAGDSGTASGPSGGLVSLSRGAFRSPRGARGRYWWGSQVEQDRQKGRLRVEVRTQMFLESSSYVG